MLEIIVTYAGYGFLILATLLLCRLPFDIIIDAFRGGR